MRISGINNINKTTFQGKIIDAHMHIGDWQCDHHSSESLDSFIKTPLSNGDTIEKVIVSNLNAMNRNGMLDEISGNIEMLNAAKNNPKIAPLAVCQPKTGSVENIKALFDNKSYKFYGLKFHPDEHEIIASDKLFDPYLKFAEKKQLPCLFHCGIQWNGDKLVDESLRYSSPEAIYTAAKKISTTPVILAHLGAGGEKVHPQAIKVLLESIDKKDANLYTDISWVDVDNPNKPTIIELIKKLKDKNALDKILFGSDAPIAEFAKGKNGLTGVEFYNQTVVDIKSAINENFGSESEDIIDKIFYKNADDLFFKKTWCNNITSQTEKNKKFKIAAAACTGIIMLGGLCICGIKKLSKPTMDTNNEINLFNNNVINKELFSSNVKFNNLENLRHIYKTVE